MEVTSEAPQEVTHFTKRSPEKGTWVSTIFISRAPGTVEPYFRQMEMARPYPNQYIRHAAFLGSIVALETPVPYVEGTGLWMSEDGLVWQAVSADPIADRYRRVVWCAAEDHFARRKALRVNPSVPEWRHELNQMLSPDYSTGGEIHGYDALSLIMSTIDGSPSRELCSDCFAEALEAEASEWDFGKLATGPGPVLFRVLDLLNEYLPAAGKAPLEAFLAGGGIFPESAEDGDLFPLLRNPDALARSVLRKYEPATPGSIS